LGGGARARSTTSGTGAIPGRRLRQTAARRQGALGPPVAADRAPPGGLARDPRQGPPRPPARSRRTLEAEARAAAGDLLSSASRTGPRAPLPAELRAELRPRAPESDPRSSSCQNVERSTGSFAVRGLETNRTPCAATGGGGWGSSMARPPSRSTRPYRRTALEVGAAERTRPPDFGPPVHHLYRPARRTGSGWIPSARMRDVGVGTSRGASVDLFPEVTIAARPARRTRVTATRRPHAPGRAGRPGAV
jgi:hypothetical protein